MLMSKPVPNPEIWGVDFTSRPTVQKSVTLARGPIVKGTFQLIDEVGESTGGRYVAARRAAWAWQRRDEGFGLPHDMDPIEGWIASVPPPPR